MILLRVPILALRCSPYPCTAALLAPTSGLLATDPERVQNDNDNHKSIATELRH
ncbi:hypothetical protein ACUXIW_001013 [Ralstonia pickettii]|uniref:Uncharacterized protein n=1 Tax=Ralstonia pickettii TaxID=329 RepID=A0ABM9II29_RALPI|nr:hypothetical protein R38712_00630 [Ralstonia pickettii]